MGKEGRCLPLTFLPDRIKRIGQNAKDLSSTDRRENKEELRKAAVPLLTHGYASDGRDLRTVGDLYTQMHVLKCHTLMTFHGG